MHTHETTFIYAKVAQQISAGQLTRCIDLISPGCCTSPAWQGVIWAGTEELPAARWKTLGHAPETGRMPAHGLEIDTLGPENVQR